MAEPDPYRPQTEFDGPLSWSWARWPTRRSITAILRARSRSATAPTGGSPEQKNKVVDDWRSKLTTPYLLQTVEAMLATMLIPKPRWTVNPIVLPGQPIEHAVARQQTGRHVEIALEREMDGDQFALKQRPFMQQDMVVGFTVGKLMWRSEKALPQVPGADDHARRGLLRERDQLGAGDGGARARAARQGRPHLRWSATCATGSGRSRRRTCRTPPGSSTAPGRRSSAWRRSRRWASTRRSRS